MQVFSDLERSVCRMVHRQVSIIIIKISFLNWYQLGNYSWRILASLIGCVFRRVGFCMAAKKGSLSVVRLIVFYSSSLNHVELWGSESSYYIISGRDSWWNLMGGFLFSNVLLKCISFPLKPALPNLWDSLMCRLPPSLGLRLIQFVGVTLLQYL